MSGHRGVITGHHIVLTLGKSNTLMVIQGLQVVLVLEIGIGKYRHHTAVLSLKLVSQGSRLRMVSSPLFSYIFLLLSKHHSIIIILIILVNH